MTKKKLPAPEFPTPWLWHWNYTNELSFVWDGLSDYIYVQHGGFGEPTVAIIPIDHEVPEHPLAVALLMFENVCDEFIEKWEAGEFDE